MGPTFSDPRTANSPPNAADGLRWFAYVEERHEGPFSTGDIQAKLVDETLQPHDFIWTNGMEDWLPLSELELFSPDAIVAAETPELSKPAVATYIPDEVFVERATPGPLSRKKKPFVLALASLVFILIGVSLLGRGSRRLETIDDISAADARALAAAIATSSGKIPTAEIAMAVGDLGSPKFYIGTNAPDGTVLQLRIEAVSDSVLAPNPPKFTQDLIVRDHIGQTTRISRASGRGLPRGNYRVRTTNFLGAILAEKTYFLGGVADETYTRELAALTANLPKQRRAELSELRQIAAALEDQLVQTISAYSSPKAWPKFSPAWIEFGKQLTTELRATPTDEEDVAYVDLFSRARAIHASILKIHADQGSALRDPNRRDSFELAVAEATSAARSGILSLQSEVGLAEKKLRLSPKN